MTVMQPCLSGDQKSFSDFCANSEVFASGAITRGRGLGLSIGRAPRIFAVQRWCRASVGKSGLRLPTVSDRPKSNRKTARNSFTCGFVKIRPLTCGFQIKKTSGINRIFVRLICNSGARFICGGGSYA
ncbi:hypothetical protein [Olsenella sp. An285]|uniref:hypothetical protein n=1 Tax=Olsenella sp. An285 TaxID=1965621 RepID=UPI00117D2E6E|nr:hypothetical protein [Olsenella sp. An285]